MNKGYPDDLDQWRDLCEWLEQRPGQCAPVWDVPDRYFGLLASANVIRRKQVDAVVLLRSMGWKLMGDWRTRLAERQQKEWGYR